LASILALAVCVEGNPVSAQQGVGGTGLRVYGVGPRLGENVQLALQNQQALGLSSEQVARLQDLQSGIEREIDPLETEIDAARLSLQTGSVSYTEGQARLQELLTRLETAAQPYRTAVAEILTANQHAALQQMLYATRPWWTPGYGRAGVGWGVVAPGPYGYGRGLGVVAPGAYGYGRGFGVGRGWGRGPGRGMGWRAWPIR
jgi:hypothetical protein